MTGKRPICLATIFDAVHDLRKPMSALHEFDVKHNDALVGWVLFRVRTHERGNGGSQIFPVGRPVSIVSGIDQHDSDHRVRGVNFNLIETEARHARNLVAQLRLELRQLESGQQRARFRWLLASKAGASLATMNPARTWPRGCASAS